MCNQECLRFALHHLRGQEVAGKDVLEVGARLVQEPELSSRRMIEALGPRTYVGVDIEAGAGVDEICAAEDLRGRHGDESFDLVVCTEVLEHVEDWRRVVSNLKHVVRPGGVLLVTTRSRGLPYHGFPHDYWRYERDDMCAIFADLEIAALEDDRSAPGVLLKAIKPLTFDEADLTKHALYSITERKRTTALVPAHRPIYALLLRTGEAVRAAYRRTLPESVKAVVRRHVRRGWYEKKAGGQFPAEVGGDSTPANSASAPSTASSKDARVNRS
jgi:SAM-dependent methyltransferase